MVDVARENVVCLEDVARKFDVSLQTVRNWANRSGHRMEHSEHDDAVRRLRARGLQF